MAAPFQYAWRREVNVKVLVEPEAFQLKLKLGNKIFNLYGYFESTQQQEHKTHTFRLTYTYPIRRSGSDPSGALRRRVRYEASELSPMSGSPVDTTTHFLSVVNQHTYILTYLFGRRMCRCSLQDVVLEKVQKTNCWCESGSAL